MDATAIAEYILKQTHSFKKIPNEFFEDIFGSQRTEKDIDHIADILKHFFHPSMCDKISNIEFEGALHQPVHWEMKGEEFEDLCNQLRAAIILARWIEECKFDSALSEFQGKKFSRVFELLISLSRVNDDVDIQWGKDAGSSGDGGIDSYGWEDNRILYIIQAKAKRLEAHFYRELFGTYILLKENSMYRKKFTSEIDHTWPYQQSVLILLTSKETPPKLKKKNNELYCTNADVKFLVMDPWAMAWFLVTKTRRDIFERKKWVIGDDDDRELLIAEISIMAEEQIPAVVVDPNDY